MAAGKFADIAARSVPNFAEAIERTQKKAGQTAPAPKLPVAGETAEQAAGRNRANAAAKKAWQDKQRAKRAKDKAKFDAMSQKDKDKKAAKDAGKKGKKAKAEVDLALGLSPAESEKLAAIEKQRQALIAKIDVDVRALLTGSER